MMPRDSIANATVEAARAAQQVEIRRAGIARQRLQEALDDAFDEPRERMRRVLVIEDFLPLQKLFIEQLSTAGYRPVGIATAEAALPMLRADAFGTVILDIGLPGMQGTELLPLLRALTPTAHIILVSGEAGERLEELRALMGANAALAKSDLGANEPLATVQRLTAAALEAGAELGALPARV